MPLDPLLGGIVSNAVGNLVSDGLEGLGNCALDLFQSYEKAYASLKRSADRLRALKDDNEFSVGQHKTKTSSGYYKQWRTDVLNVLQQVEQLEGESSSFLSNVLNMSNPCERVEQIASDVQSLLQDGQFCDSFLVDKPPEPVVKINPPDIKRYPTLQQPLEKILRLLSCDQVNAVGILGPLGVGKTTIMQNLNDHEEVARMFQMVIWIKVSMGSTKETLQKAVARRLKINLEAAIHSDELARSISEELKDKQFLLLVDIDGMDSIDMNGIGIPNNNNGSKVVLATEFRHVCRSMANMTIKLDPLSPDEAWKMFKQIVSDNIDRPDVGEIAQLVVKECGGLPLLIKIVASSFKLKNDAAEWRNGLEELKNWSDVEISGLKELVGFIKFCYDNLKDEEKKKCFLYGALHPVGTKISADYLVKCWAAERLLGKVDEQRSFRAACDKGYATLRLLTDVSLLQEEGERSEHVQVNHLVRQAALHISSEFDDCEFQIGEVASNSSWEQAKRIFAIDTKLDHLPPTPRSSKLVSLLLHRNPGLKRVPPLFFRAMKKLLVLNMHKTGIEELPPSFQLLTELKALFLNDTSLEELPFHIENLRVLEVLDIRGCKVIFIPGSIGKLAFLRCLRVSYYKSDTVIDERQMEADGNVISSLSRLEELVIDVVSYEQWCVEAAIVIQHVALLEKLTSLKIHFPKLGDLQTLLTSKPAWRGREQITSFWTTIGHPSDNQPEILDCLGYKINRYLRYCYDGHNYDCTASNMFPETDALELIDHRNITCLSQFMQAPGLHQVRGCLVERCREMVSLVEGGADILPKLEHLHARSLPKLKSIFEVPLSGGTLSKLHTIVVQNCPELTSSGLIQQLTALKKLTIRSCSNIEVLIPPGSGVGSVQNLKVLELVDLPKLRAISEDASFKCPRLKELMVSVCPQLKTLPFNKHNAKRLKLIEGEQDWWDALQFHFKTKQLFQRIFKSRVSF